jgi:cytochrome bd ubiquinol oxidase subunit II
MAVLAGAAILFPSLALLFRLVLGGDLGRGEGAAERPAQPRSLLAALAPGLLPRLAIGCLVAGIGFLTISTQPGRIPSA